MKPYILRRRDVPVAILNITEDGTILDYRCVPGNEALLPLHDEKSTDWLKRWWSRRSVPISQGHIKAMLENKGLISPGDYLVKNLGLSLNDYYWISPVDSGMFWKDVNLFTNEFYDDINIAGEPEETEGRVHHDMPGSSLRGNIPHYTPNSSLQGTLEKCWTIRGGIRGMIKGNRGSVSAESMNEVIAGRLHELQHFQNYTRYELLEVHGRPYQYGCFSEIFTSDKLELISAYDVMISKKKKSDTNTYEHFIHVCTEHGMEEVNLRPFLEYQIMTDFILSNRDRHLANVAVLRDADSLEFVKPAPIYDTGKSMFVDASVPLSEKGMLKIETESFMSTELKLLSLVQDRTLVDSSKLPTPEFIEKLYSMDENMEAGRIRDILRGYEMKIDLFERWQRGEPFSVLRRK